jgi:hypothetical protein
MRDLAMLPFNALGILMSENMWFHSAVLATNICILG